MLKTVMCPQRPFPWLTLESAAFKAPLEFQRQKQPWKSSPRRERMKNEHTALYL